MIGRGVTLIEHLTFGTLGFALFCVDEAQRWRRERAIRAAREEVLQCVRNADTTVIAAVLAETRGKNDMLAREMRALARADGHLWALEHPTKGGGNS